MQYLQEIEGCLSDKVGERGVTAAALEEVVTQTKPGLDFIRRAHDDRSLPILSLYKDDSDLDACDQLAEWVPDSTTDILVLGTGGSSLGAQALAQIVGHRVTGFAWPQDVPRFHFFDNLDGVSFSRALAGLDLSTCYVLGISKSGGTAETMIQILATIQAFENKGMTDRLLQQMAVITTNADNPLRRLAQKYGLTIFDHDPDIGGRFSVLSNVGLLPAILMGLDAKQVREGAGEVVKAALAAQTPGSVPAAVGAALSMLLDREKGVKTSVLMPYTDRLELFAMWYRQLWAESLGKEGHGTTPVRALGPVDQHSQLQLYLSGPHDKLITIIMTDAAGTGPRIDSSFASDPDLAYLTDRTVGDLQDAEQRATADTLIKNNRPVRILRIKDVDEASMGALFMHFMLETIIAADLLGINAFDQPAVEEGKVLARSYLAEMV